MYAIRIAKESYLSLLTQLLTIEQQSTAHTVHRFSIYCALPNKSIEEEEEKKTTLQYKSTKLKKKKPQS